MWEQQYEKKAYLSGLLPLKLFTVLKKLWRVGREAGARSNISRCLLVGQTHGDTNCSSLDDLSVNPTGACAWLEQTKQAKQGLINCYEKSKNKKKLSFFEMSSQGGRGEGLEHSVPPQIRVQKGNTSNLAKEKR